MCSATWFQPSHPTSPRPPTVPRVNLAFIRALHFFIALFAVVRPFGPMAVGTNGLAYGFNAIGCAANWSGHADTVSTNLGT